MAARSGRTGGNMNTCNRCGANIDDGAIFCPLCGARYDEKAKRKNTRGTDTGSGGSYDPRYGYIPEYAQHFSPNLEGRSRWLVVLGFVFPFVGLILWYVWRFSKPGKAASAADGALSFACFSWPLLGAVLWYIWRFTRRDKAKMCGLSAIIGFIFNLALTGILVALVYGYGIAVPGMGLPV